MMCLSEITSISFLFVFWFPFCIFVFVGTVLSRLLDHQVSAGSDEKNVTCIDL